MIWDIETPGLSKPIEDTCVEKWVITFTSPEGEAYVTPPRTLVYSGAPEL